ncbi:MAG: hypothetical protein ABIP14_14160 [Blastocatellia bacterium]
MDETINTSSNASSNTGRQMLRHAIATVAYRGKKAIANAPESFAEFCVNGPDKNLAIIPVKTPAQILAHIGDLFDWALLLAKGEYAWRGSAPLAWAEETARFSRVLEAFDQYLASEEPLLAPAEKLFQGPIADALTHIGQIAMLRRISASPIKGENYFKAEIIVGRFGVEPSNNRAEFD